MKKIEQKSIAINIDYRMRHLLTNAVSHQKWLRFIGMPKRIVSTSTDTADAMLTFISESTPSTTSSDPTSVVLDAAVHLSLRDDLLASAELTRAKLTVESKSRQWGAMVWRHERPFASTTIRMMPVQEAAKLWTLRLVLPHGIVSGESTSTSSSLSVTAAAGDLVIFHPLSDSNTLPPPSMVAGMLGKLDITPCLSFARLRKQQLLESISATREMVKAAAAANGEDIPAAQAGALLQRYANISVVNEV